jgi:predicted transcriptional regulator
MDLFSKEVDLKIYRITKEDVTLQTDKYNLFRQTISKHEEMYPNILTWLDSRVVSGIKENRRIAYIGFIDDLPSATAVIKLGKSSKFCHLHLEDNLLNQNIGELFFAMMTLDVRNSANSIHFTLPEDLWYRKKSFFESFGFDEIEKSKTQYRNGVEELSCESSFVNVWEHTMDKIPKLIEKNIHTSINPFSGILMSIHPRYIKKILDGEKIYEVRKRFSEKWLNRRVTLYATSPSKALYGYANVKKIVSGTVDYIWNNFSEDLGCSRREFYDYADDNEKIYLIQLGDIQPYISPIYISQISRYFNQNLIPPQSYTSLSSNKNWTDAVSIADLLQGRFSSYIQLA